MTLTLFDLVEMPVKKILDPYNSAQSKTQYAIWVGYNEALDLISSLPISKAKLLAMVGVDREKICEIMLNKRYGIYGYKIPPHAYKYAMEYAQAISANLKDVLVFKGGK